MTMFEDNCRFFIETLPYGKGLVQKLVDIPQGAYEFTGLESAESLNLRRNGQPVYAGSALSHAKEEATRYLNNPERYYIIKPYTQIDVGRAGSRFRSALYQKIKDWSYHEEPTSDAGYAAIFGLGLGMHVNLLAQYLPVEHLILAETDLVMFRASCEVFPWHQFIRSFEAQGKRVSLRVYENGEAVGTSAMSAMRDEYHALLDGSYIYHHNSGPSETMDAARRTFDSALITLEYSMGFFEDECLMFKNAMANLARNSFHLMPKEAESNLGLPAMVVGSGPSVDKAMPSIKENADKAFVFSGGTSFSVLSRNGITADFHAQFENDPLNYDVVTAVVKDHSFKDTYLVAPMTIDPRIPPYFKEVFFYFRDALSPTMLLASKDQIVTSAGPTVSNTSTRAAISMGNDAIILFGVDLGGPSPEDHHSKDSIYHYAKDDVGEETGAVVGEIPDADPQCFPVPGNQQEVVYTSRILTQARLYFEGLFLANQQVPVYNCSDGVKIKGATDILPEQLRIKPQPLTKEEAVAKIKDRWDYFEAGGYVAPEKLDEFEEAYFKILSEVEYLCRSDLDETIQDFCQKVQKTALIAQIETLAGAENAAKTVILGTLLQILQTGHYLYRRLEEGKEVEFMQLFKAEILPFIQEFREVMGEVIQDARAEIAQAS